MLSINISYLFIEIEIEIDVIYKTKNPIEKHLTNEILFGFRSQIYKLDLMKGFIILQTQKYPKLFCDNINCENSCFALMIKNYDYKVPTQEQNCVLINFKKIVRKKYLNA